MTSMEKNTLKLAGTVTNEEQSTFFALYKVNYDICTVHLIGF